MLALVIAFFGQWWQIARARSADARADPAEARAAADEVRLEEAHRLAVASSSAEFEEAAHAWGDLGEKSRMLEIAVLNTGGAAARNVTALIYFGDDPQPAMITTERYGSVSPGEAAAFHWPFDVGETFVPDFSQGLPAQMIGWRLELNYTDNRGDRFQKVGEPSVPRVPLPTVPPGPAPES